jgi:hypothetical protein
MSEPCDCCQGTQVLTPLATANRPGLPALSFRVGTHATFFETMKARLSSADFPSLAGLTTRDVSDPSIALLDAWALVADILTFYQERVVNEGYLRTATERRSVLELGRLVGYKLRPGVAASVSLVFTLDAGSETTIPAGTRVQSVPGPGEMPQTFETSKDLTARGAWNNLQPRTTRPQLIAPDEIRPGRRIYLQGIATNLKPNDPILFDGDYDPRQLTGVLTPAHDQRVPPVATDATANVTTVVLQPWSTALVQFRQKAASLAPPGGDGVTQQIDAILAEFAPLHSFNGTSGFPPDVPLDTRIGRRVYEALLPLGSGSGAVAPRPTAASLPDTQSAVREEDRRAETGKYPRLAPWLDDLLGDLEQAAPVSMAAVARGLAPAAVGATTTPTTPPVSGTLQGLSTPPSTPVARDAQSLSRPLGRTFTAGSEAGSRLLSTLDPAVGENLYDALAGVANPRLATSRATITMRVKAAPFGNIASLRPVLDGRGFSVGTEEWPLRTRSVGVSFPRLAPTPPTATQPPVTTFPSVAVTATVDAGTGVRTAVVRLDATKPTTVPFPPPLPGGDDGLAVTATVTQPAPGTTGSAASTVTFDFANKAGGKFKSFALALGAFAAVPGAVTVAAEAPPVPASRPVARAAAVTTTLELSLTVDDDPPQPIIPDTTNRYSRGPGDVVTVVSSSTSTVVLSVLEESPATDVGLEPDFFKTLTLDALYDQIAMGSRVLIERPAPASSSGLLALDVYVVSGVRTVARALYNLTGKVTELTLDRPWLTTQDTSLSVLRHTTVYGQEGSLPLADAPFDGDVEGDLIELDGIYNGLQPGRWVVVAGERTDIPGTTGVTDAELVMVGGSDLLATSFLPGLDSSTGLVVPNAAQVALPGDSLHTVLRLANPLAFSYKRDTVKVYGNVADSTNGETRKEVLGSGDAGRSLQSFVLKQKPLTFVSADTPTGVSSTLQVYVNSVRWHEETRPDLLGPTDRAFVATTDDDDNVTVTFGDGVHGARPPTGVNNVTAAYRFGIGTGGNVAAGQVSQLSTRPLHVTGVVNPIAASGGGDREELDQARRNIPLGLSALDRLVSTSDYEDFAHTFAGITKASAVQLTDGRRRVVHLTVAGDQDGSIERSSDLYRNLTQALADFGDPAQPVRIDPRTLRLLVLDAGVRIDPDFLWAPVADQVRSALLDAFGFDNRGLGQDVYLGELVREIQSVPGVDYVDVTTFGAIPPPDFDPTEPLTPDELSGLVSDLVAAQSQAGGPSPRVPVSMATFAGGVVRPAQLAVFSPDVPQTINLRQILP